LGRVPWTEQDEEGKRSLETVKAGLVDQIRKTLIGTLRGSFGAKEGSSNLGQIYPAKGSRSYTHQGKRSQPKKSKSKRKKKENISRMGEREFLSPGSGEFLLQWNMAKKPLLTKKGKEPCSP